MIISDAVKIIGCGLDNLDVKITARGQLCT